MTNAVLQFVAATDNIAITEYPNPFAASTADHLTGSGVKLRQCDMVDHIPEFKDGYLSVPEEPGIGIDVIPNLEEKFPWCWAEASAAWKKRERHLRWARTPFRWRAVS